MTEQEFETILAKHSSLIEDGLRLLGRQVGLGRKHLDLLFEDRHGQRLIVELKKGPILRDHVAQVMDYEGHFLSPDDPTTRVMLIGNRVPENFRRSLNHHGVEWREITVARLVDSMRACGDSEMLALLEPEQTHVGSAFPGRVDTPTPPEKVAKMSIEGAPALPPSLTLKEVKQQLADRYIKDLTQKRIFLKRATSFKTWANYIAALVLTNAGRTPFGPSDIQETLQTLMPEHYDRKGAKKGSVLTADVEVSQTTYNLGLPCLERVPNTSSYRFIGFKVDD